jgi:hypothetical protein
VLDGFIARFPVDGVRPVVAVVVVVAFFAVAAGLAEARDATPCVFFAAAFFTGDDFLAAVPRVDAAARSAALEVARLPAVETGFTVLDALAAPPFLAGVFFAGRVDDAAFFDAPRFASVDLADAAVFFANGFFATAFFARGFFVTVFFAGGRLPAAAFGVAAFLAGCFVAVVFFAAAFLAPLVLPAAEARTDVFLPAVPVVLAMHGLLVARRDHRNLKARTRTPRSCEIRVSRRGRDHPAFMEPAIG